MRSAGAIAIVTALLVSAAPARGASLPYDMQALVNAGAPGVIVFARNGTRSLRLAAGVADRAHGTPMRIGDRFRVGSVTKTFVAALVLQLAGEGKLSLDDTVEKWVPGLVPGGDRITVRELLNHTSGLFDYLNDGDGTVLQPYVKGDLGHVWTPQAIVGVATKHPPHFPPGGGWSYSNTGYIVLGLIVEAATGDSLAAELKRPLFVWGGPRLGPGRRLPGLPHLRVQQRRRPAPGGRGDQRRRALQARGARGLAGGRHRVLRRVSRLTQPATSTSPVRSTWCHGR